MLVKEKTSEPIKITLQNGVPQTVRFEYKTFVVTDDISMAEVLDKIAEGIEIISQIALKDKVYITTRKIIPLKVEIAK